MGRSIAQRLAAVRATRNQAVGVWSGRDIDAQVKLIAEAVGAPEKPKGYHWTATEGEARLVPRDVLPAVPPINRCVACQAWAGHMVAAVSTTEGTPLAALPAAPPCWGTHQEVA